MCFMRVSEQTAIISLYSINWLDFIIEVESVYCAVRTGFLNQTRLRPWSVKRVLCFVQLLAVRDTLCGRNFLSCGVCLFVFGATAAPSPPSGPGSPQSRGFYFTLNDAPQSVALLWTSDRFVAETSTWQHTTVTTDKRPCSQWDSNQQASGRRPTP
jgi:hypothetical protein